MRTLLDRRVLFVGGKGGVGKTTCASALALAAADSDKRCLLVSTDPAHSLGDIFGRAIGEKETALTPNLTGIEIDPDIEANRHIETVKTNMRGLVRPELYGEVGRQMDLARFAPGAVEAALLERVADLIADGLERFDLVIFDTAPTGLTPHPQATLFACSRCRR
jgi:arsenite-transporting ATPase